MGNRRQSMYSLSNLRKSNEYWNYSVRQIKDKLLSMNVSIDECIEKRDLIQKLKEYETWGDTNKCTKPAPKKYPKPTAQKTQKQFVSSSNNNNKLKNKPSILYEDILNDSRESKQQIMNRIDSWIIRWSYRRSFRQILNCVLEYKSNDERYITRGNQSDHNYALMMKMYKKAILLIHPDKHYNSSFEVKYKAAEMFKILTARCDKYKERHIARKKMG